jgi:sugar phosphate isomerase/epimerase
MFTLSAFADEISPDPQEQIDVLTRCGVRHIELRSIHKTNVLDLSDAQVADFKAMLDRNGFRLSAIGSPIGKVKVDSPFEPHLKRFQRAVELCKVFGTPNIRVFSYYPPGDAEDWNGVSDSWEHELFRRLEEQVRLASRAGVRLVHENEHRIYGDSPERVSRLFQMLQHDAFRAVYDAANYVYCGHDPWDGWQKTKEWTAHFHIKDWKTGEKHGVPAGEGHGRLPEVIADAVKRGYDGFAVLEPHLLGGGPTGGVTGPELFPKAVEAFTAILDRAGAQYQ